MNPPFSAAMSVSLGTAGRFDFAVIATLDFDVDDARTTSLSAGGRLDFPVAALSFARASGVRKENTDFPGRGVSPSRAPRSLGASWICVEGPSGAVPRTGGCGM